MEPRLDDGIEIVAYGQWPGIAKVEIGQHQAGDDVEGPGVNAFVKASGDHGCAGCNLCEGRRLGRGDDPLGEPALASDKEARGGEAGWMRSRDNG